MSIAQKQTATQSHKANDLCPVHVLYGLATLFTELIPKFQWGSWSSPWSTSCSFP